MIAIFVFNHPTFYIKTKYLSSRSKCTQKSKSKEILRIAKYIHKETKNRGKLKMQIGRNEWSEIDKTKEN